MQPTNRISAIKAREIMDCRGTPTVQVDVWVEGMLQGRADVPSGRSTGSHEAYEMRDGGTRYGGFGVQKAITHVNTVIADTLKGRDVTEQRAIDRDLVALDGTPNKSRLGANAILGVSLAVARAAAHSLNLPLYRYLNSEAHVLPVPMMNLINGGKLSSNDLCFQEFIMMPVGAPSFSEALRMTAEINAILRPMTAERYGKLAINVGDEGGVVPPIVDVREALDLLCEAVSRSGYAEHIVYAFDCAATHLYDKSTGLYTFEGRNLTRDEVIRFFEALVSEYPIVSIEDPLQEDDFEGFAEITRALQGVQIVGDDLFVTNKTRLAQGLAGGSANAVLWKVNQIGTLTEAMETATMAFRNGYGVCVSERSGETEDPMIADLVVALNGGQIKTGAPVRSERTAKYNRLLQIEEELGSAASYAGRSFRRPV
ncbi:MAG: phosphopyruvate hydratase [Dehalococcoidia bacterium]|nr:phosphopyruvate hydratase [Dehalococcoidia bacterium]